MNWVLDNFKCCYISFQFFKYIPIFHGCGICPILQFDFQTFKISWFVSQFFFFNYRIEYYQMLEYLFLIFQISSNSSRFCHQFNFSRFCHLSIWFWMSPDNQSNFSRYIQRVRLIGIPITGLVSMFLCIPMNWDSQMLDISFQFFKCLSIF